MAVVYTCVELYNHGALQQEVSLSTYCTALVELISCDQYLREKEGIPGS